VRDQLLEKAATTTAAAKDKDDPDNTSATIASKAAS
jgi:hypothetical protein